MTFVYFFGAGQADGNASMKNELGGKGANLAEMTSLGLPVPAGFTISTAVCMDFLKNGEKYPPELKEQVSAAIKKMQDIMGAQFADSQNPLLVSVRSGARASMPGMMDTVLNLGLNDVTVEGLAKKTSNPRFAFDAYRRFIQMFSNVVKNLDSHYMEDALEKLKQQKGYKEDTQMTADDLKNIVGEFKKIYLLKLNEAFPQDPQEQLWAAIGAVFRSWNGARARKYREINEIPDNWGTAVNICSMVFGNMGETSGTGVCFTRDPSTGENQFYGEYLMNAQGEDVVAGIRTPKTLSEMKKDMPPVYEQLESVRKKLEHHYRDVQDIEFTVQEGKLWLLQTRNAKRTTKAALRIAIDLVNEKIIDKKEALRRVKPTDLDQLLHPTLDPHAKKHVMARGLPASPGAASGRVVFSAADAESWAARDEKVILVRDETSPEDIGGMHASQGFLTARGGMTSHAAVVARQMGKCCIAGCGQLRISAAKKMFSIDGTDVFEGDWITIDGSTGEVILGKVPTREPEMGGDFLTFMKWSAEITQLKVRANADTPVDAKYARNFGAEGIGLCRTEHMFFDENRLPVVRKMILATSSVERLGALNELLPFQRDDFAKILEAMEGFPVTIRLLDPPLHEFLPHSAQEMASLSAQINLSVDEIQSRTDSLRESNPMLGHRGCRLGISHPEIYEMQVRAIVEATVGLRAKGKNVQPEIMIPLVGMVAELKWLRERLEVLAKDIYEKESQKSGNKKPFHIPFGTMIEIPRAALTADEVATQADFFSFGTNDLTQTTFGFSRDDSTSFLRAYRQNEILVDDPFAVIDRQGVGKLMEIATTLGRKTNPNIKLGICGEHGGEPKSIQFCQELGLNYVSCSPFRVPIAILSAAQAALK